jgi:hypothetical protein
MANIHQLKVEFDVVEPRPQYGRLMAPLDGTKVDLTNSNNIWQDPATLTMMLAPLPVTAAWNTTYSGSYARFQKTDYTLTTAAKWKQMQIRASGDYYLQSLDVTERATLTTAWSNNQPAYLSLYVPGLKDTDKSIILKAGWGVGSAGSVEVWFAANGSAQVYKSGVLVGSYDRGDANIAPAVGTTASKSSRSDFISIMMIPARRRELIVATSNGTHFSHVFEDLSPALNNVIVPAAAFSWLVPSGQATVQLAKCAFETSGYVLSQIKSLRYPPPTGATFSGTFAGDPIGVGANTYTGSVVKADGTAYTPNGVIKDVRAKVALTGPGTGTFGLYTVEMLYDAAVGATYDGTVDVTQYIQSLSLAVDEDGKSTCTIGAIAKSLIDAGVQKPNVTSDRPVRIALGDGPAVYPGVVTYQDIFRGTLQPPKIEFLDRDTTASWATYVYTGTDRSGDFELAWIVESYPYDGITAGNAILDLMKIAGYDDAVTPYFGGDFPDQELPYTTNISKGQYSLAPDYGDNVKSYLDKIKQEYYATWITGWMPTASGYYYQWLNVNAASTASTMTLYQSIANATTAGVAEELRPQRVIRSLNSYNEEPECTQVTVIGQDPNTGIFIPYTQINAAAEIANTAPASRPRSWRGRPVCYQYRDPALNTLDAVTAACLMLYTRLTTGRTMIEFDATFLVYNVSNRPVWLGDVIKLMDTDGVGVLGNYRIIAIPSIEFVQENTVGSSTLFNVRRASYRAVYVSAGT